MVFARTIRGRVVVGMLRRYQTNESNRISAWSKTRTARVHRHRFVELFYFVLVISVLASSRLDAASLQLSWVDNSDNEDGFHIERKVGTNGIFSLLAAVGPNITSYTDDNLASNTTYCYRLNAFNDIGISAYTNEACGTTSGGASPPPTPPAPSSNTVVTNITDGAVLSGTSVVWTATPSGSPVRVEFFIDGALSGTEYVAPYQFNGDPSGTLDTNTLSDGSHQLRVRAVYSNNSTAEQTVTVIVSNGASPTPTSPPSSGNSISMNIANNSVLSGSSVIWTATPSGSPMRIEFFIDNTLSWTEYVAPYQFNEDPSLHVALTILSDGSHQLRVRDVYSNNSTAEQTV